VRHFAREQLAQHADLARKSQARHVAYYLTLVAGWQPTEAAEARFRTAVQADLGNVETAWAWALAQNQYPLLLAAVEGLAEFYQMTGAFHVAEALFAESITQVRAHLSKPAHSELPSTSPRSGATSAGSAPCGECTAQQLLATLLLYQSDVCVGLAQLVQAQAAAAEALTLAEPLGVAKLLVRSYYALAVVALSQSQFERTQTLCEKAIHLAQPQGLWREEAFCLGIASVADSDHQTRVTGLQYQMQALALAEAHQDSRQALRFRTFLGAAYRDLGNFSAALHCFEQNLVLLRRREDRYNVALTTINLGALLLLLGDYDAAANALAEGSEQLRLLRQNRLLAQCLALLGALRLAQGNHTAAAAVCRQALDQPHIILMAQQIAWLTLGDLHGAQGALSAAQRAYQQVIALTPEPNAPARLMAQAGLATLRLVHEDAAAALTALEALLPAFDPERFDIIFTAQRFLLAAYQILAANQDARAAGILQHAWQLVTTSAARISDPRLRQSYLTQVPVHRTIGQLIDAQR
jgi:tetratricopeptide (TPR) repeat protein